MSSQAFPISAAEAQRQAAHFQRQMNAQRRVPELPTQLKKLSKQQTVHVYNVGPWEHTRHLGTAGTFFIPKCEPGEKFARMAPIDGIPIDLEVKDEKSMALLLEDGGGQYLAEQIVGTGKHLAASASLVKVGVFIGSRIGPDAKPTNEELQQAEETLDGYAQDLVVEARRAYETGPKEAENVIRDQHHWAGKRLNLDPKVELWMGRKTATLRASCEGCGTPIDGDPILCPTCKYILDRPRYEKNKANFAA